MRSFDLPFETALLDNPHSLVLQVFEALCVRCADRPGTPDHLICRRTPSRKMNGPGHNLLGIATL
jgi:hypothetical protein